jgi:glycosyltransferase involved in cell wall biosynthesis
MRALANLKISIVTPCYNAQRFIEETIGSVLNQAAVRAGRVELEYLVIDGASTDATLDIVRSLQAAQLTVVSAQDRGMYDALASGLSRATGDVVAYLNAGDYYHPHAFDAIIDIFNNPAVSWITGYSTIYNENGVVTKITSPFIYRRRLFECGAYGKTLPFVQQESTFWRRELIKSVDLANLSRMKLAGDSYLWRCFSSVAELYIAETSLGGFRKHKGQLSESVKQYMEEASTFTRSPSIFDRLISFFDRVLWEAPWRFKKILNRRRYLCFDHASNQWR